MGVGVKLSGCYLWGGVIVEDGATLTGCICGEGVRIGVGAVVPAGCVLGRSVVVGARTTLTRFARFWAPSDAALKVAANEEADAAADDDAVADDDDAEADAGAVGRESSARARVTLATSQLLAKCSAGTGLTLLGPGGHGRLWKVVPTAASLGFDRPVAQGQCDDELSEEEEEELEETNLEDVENEQFATAVRELIRDALRSADKDDAVENLALELNGLKFGADRTFADSVRAIVPPLLAEAASAPTKKAKVANLKRSLEKWAPLLKKFVQSKADQRALVEGVAAACEQANEGLLEVFDHALKLLYDREDDLLDEQAILKWPLRSRRRPRRARSNNDFLSRPTGCSRGCENPMTTRRTTTMSELSAQSPVERATQCSGVGSAFGPLSHVRCRVTCVRAHGILRSSASGGVRCGLCVTIIRLTYDLSPRPHPARRAPNTRGYYAAASHTALPQHRARLQRL